MTLVNTVRYQSPLSPSNAKNAKMGESCALAGAKLSNAMAREVLVQCFVSHRAASAGATRQKLLAQLPDAADAISRAHYATVCRADRYFEHTARNKLHKRYILTTNHAASMYRHSQHFGVPSTARMP